MGLWAAPFLQEMPLAHGSRQVPLSAGHGLPACCRAACKATCASAPGSSVLLHNTPTPSEKGGHPGTPLLWSPPRPRTLLPGAVLESQDEMP